MLTETEKAWMAGFMDGEGCFTIGKQIRKNRPSPSYRVYITVANTDKTSLESFVKEYGGKIYNIHERRKDKKGVNWSDAHDWYCPISSSKRLLLDLLPFLRLKRQQSEIILQFLQKKHKFKRRSLGQGHGSSPLSPNEIACYENFRLQVHALNHKGIYARSLPKLVNDDSKIKKKEINNGYRSLY